MNDREYILSLDKKRLLLEKEIGDITEYLNQDGFPGVDKSLIDQQGFPLAGLDLYAIRDARNTLIKKQNDHKGIMLLIEEKMSQFFNTEKKDNQIISNSLKNEDEDKNLVQVFEDDEVDKKIKVSFAVISSIIEGSPADQCGLCEGDNVLMFDDIDINEKNPLERVGNIVKQKENQIIKVIISRKNQLNSILINLIPKKWEGNGLLGCKLTLKN